MVLPRGEIVGTSVLFVLLVRATLLHAIVRAYVWATQLWGHACPSPICLSEVGTKVSIACESWSGSSLTWVRLMSSQILDCSLDSKLGRSRDTRSSLRLGYARTMTIKKYFDQKINKKVYIKEGEILNSRWYDQLIEYKVDQSNRWIYWFYDIHQVNKISYR